MIKLQRPSKLNQAGFTGIEVLIVLVIITIITLLVMNNLQSATAESRDVERRTDINALQNALESHWHTNESYPVDLNGLQLHSDILTDPSGNTIEIGTATDSDNKPSSSYTIAQPDKEYTYFPYLCGTETAEEETEDEDDADEDEETEDEAPAEAAPDSAVQTCQKYVLYSWLERAASDEIPYEQNNIHNQD